MDKSDQFTETVNQFGELIMRQMMRNVFHYSKESGLSMSQIGALFQLHKGASAVSDLGDVVGVSSAAASQMLDRLVQQDLILRTEDPHDRRAKQIVLTEKGRQILQEILHARQGWLDDLSKVLTAEEKESVRSALQILIDKAVLHNHHAETVQ